nr:hypothetical protein [uncultured Cohaesibacter sp.]
MFEHSARHLEQTLVWLKRADDFPELTFDLVTRDGFAVTGAFFIIAAIIGIFFVFALGPYSLVVLSALPADYKTAQRKILAYVFTCRRVATRFEITLDFLEGIKRD